LVSALAALFLAAACAAPPRIPETDTTETPSPAPTLTSRFSTHVGTLSRATLPPTWTPTATPSPTQTPTLSEARTPTPVTPTLSESQTPAPAPDAAELCDSFVVNAPIPYGYPFAWDATIRLILGTPLTAVREGGRLDSLVVRFLAMNPLSGKNQGVQIPAGQVIMLEFPVNQLPAPGVYVWTVSIHGDTIGDRCVHRGLFFAVPPDAAATPAAAP
jgi:hypothetical protein